MACLIADMDEEGDRITVRGDDELFAMIDYVSRMHEIGKPVD